MPIENKYLKFIISFICIGLAHGLCAYRNGNLGFLSISDAIIVICSRGVSAGYAMLMAASACACADLIGGFRYYALYTFIIKGGLGFLAGWLNQKRQISFRRIIFLLIGASVLKFGVDLWFYGIDIIQHAAISMLLNFSMNLLVYVLYRTYVLKRVKK